MRNLLNQSVKFGNLHIPAASLQSALGKYCINLCVWTHDEIYKIRLVGTAIPIFFHGHYLLVCISHQLDGVDPQDVCVLYPDGSLAVTCSGVRAFNPNNMNVDTDAYDVAAFEFTEPCQEHPVMKALFYEISELPPDVHSDNVLALIVAGFPSSDQLYELEENNHLGSVKRNVIALPDGQPADKSLMRARFVESLEFEPDGLKWKPGLCDSI